MYLPQLHPMSFTPLQHLFMYISTHKGVLWVLTKVVYPVNTYLGVVYTIYTYFRST